MWETSSAFNDALTRSRRIATRVEVLYGGKTVTALNVVVQGSVTAEHETVRRSGSVRLIDPDGTLTPVTAKDLLAPRGTELRIFKGLHLPGVTDPEMVPLATLRISEPQVRRDEGGLTIDVKGYDRGRAIQRARFRDPYSIPNGTPVSQAISDIITSRSTFPVNIVPTTTTTPALVFEALSDPWDAIHQLAQSISYEAFFDVLGTFVARPVPNYETQSPVWTYEPGQVSLLLHNQREMSDENCYSGVVVTSEHPDNPNPIRVTVWDTNPQSPTYYDPALPHLSTFGPVPYGFASPIIKTEAQAILAGQTVLARVSGLLEQVEVDVLGHFGHDIGDVVTVRDPDTRLQGTHIIEQIVQPIRRGHMTLRMRARRVVMV
jgi:hypothetical protein